MKIPEKDDLISRQDAIDCVGWGDSITKVIDRIKSLPSADRPIGEWVVGDAFPHNVYCSNCYKTFAQDGWEVWKDGTLPRNYCPYCGAKMRGEEE